MKKSKWPTNPNTPNDAITVSNLSIIFEKNTENEKIVLENFNYTFKKGKIYFIIGNSGTGKTTLVSHFNGLLKSKQGNIFIEDIPIYDFKKRIKNFKKLRKKIGMVLQFPEYQLFKDTIEKDIMFGPINLGDSHEIAKQKAKKYLNQMQLDDSFLQKSPFGLSGGQKRRVAIAGILAIEPNIIIFDEPTAGLDPAGEKEMMHIIKELKNQDKTIIVITHVMDQVLELADEILLLGNKKILASGDAYKIFLDKDIINNTKIDVPKVIDIINKLILIDPKYKKIYESKPKNIEELATSILEIKNKEKNNGCF